MPHDERRESFGRFVDEQDPVVAVQQRTGERHHLLLPARERPGFLRRALLELRKQFVHEIVPQRRPGALGEPQVFLDGQPGEHVAIFGDVRDAAAHDLVHGELRRFGALEHDAPRARHESEDPAQRRRLADAVAPEQPGDPARAHVERDALENVGLRQVDVEIAHREQRCGRAHSGSPRYADWTISLATMRSGVSIASSWPWCITAMRSASPMIRSMRCSTISTVLC